MGARAWITLFAGESLRAIARNKLRSALSAIGITIGVAAVVLMVAMGQAGAARTAEQMHNLGDNLVWIEAGSRTVNGLRTGSHGTTTLTVEDAEAIRSDVKLLKRVSVNIDGSLHLGYGDRNWHTRFRGVEPDYLPIKTWEIERGQSFTDEDVKNMSSVCVIGETVRRELLGDDEPIGTQILVNGQPFVVIGVLKPKGQTQYGMDQDDTIMMPYTTAERKVRGARQTWLDDILCSAVTPDAVEPAIEKVSALLRERHGIRAGEADDFNIRRPDLVVKASGETSRTFSFLLFCVALISLVVGGIGIMNVMLAAVVERTREIGVRLAVGATRRAVELQFLAEAIVLAVCGGLAGVGLSLAGRQILARILGVPIGLPLEALGLALAFSFCVGAVFGFYPARRAARLDPIEALRHE